MPLQQHHTECHHLPVFRLYIQLKGSSGFVEGRSADLAIGVGDCVVEGADGTVDLVAFLGEICILGEASPLLDFHRLILGGLLGGWFFGDGFRRGRGVGVAVEAVEGLGVLDVFADSQLVLYLAERRVGVRLVEVVFLLAFAGQEANGPRQVGVGAVDVDHHYFAVLRPVGDLDEVQVVIDFACSLDIYLHWHDLLDGFQWLAWRRRKHNCLRLDRNGRDWLLFRFDLGGSLLCFLGERFFIEKADKLFLLGFLDVLGLDGQRFAGLLEEPENVGVVSGECFEATVDEVCIEIGISPAIGQRFHSEERHAVNVDLHLAEWVLEGVCLHSLTNLPDDLHEHRYLQGLDPLVQVIEVEVAEGDLLDSLLMFLVGETGQSVDHLVDEGTQPVDVAQVGVGGGRLCDQVVHGLLRT